MKRRWVRMLGIVTIGAIAAVLLGPSNAVGPDPLHPDNYMPAPPSTGTVHAPPFFGTRVRFEASPETAFLRAEREGKLVLLLHLSGEFGSSETT